MNKELFDAIERYREAHQTYAGLLGDCAAAETKVEELEKKCEEQEKAMREAESRVMEIVREMASDPLPLKWR